MAKTKIILIILMLVSMAACARPENEHIGQWQRMISDDELGICGIERLSISDDSCFEINNNLRMAYTDSNFDYRSEFTTAIKGRWSIAGDQFVMHIDNSSFSFDTIPGKTVLVAVRDISVPGHNEALAAMGNDIINNMRNYYCEAYAEMNQIVISQHQIIGDTTFAGLCNGARVLWHRVE